MSLSIDPGPEPNTHATRRTDRTSVLAESDAYRIFTNELRRYCEGEINGRSFLIAGHRGSGKTTLVLHAVEELREESRQEQYPFLPLLVPLHGPSLLSQSADGGKSGKGVQVQPTANALIQITLGLYRALVTDFTEQYQERLLRRERLEEARTNRSSRRQRARREIMESLEVLRQAEFEFDDYVEPARLRDYWRRAGFLAEGVLFPEGHRRRPDQGFREILALASASEAYRRISGEFVQEEKQSAGAEAKTEASVALDSTKTDLMSPLIALSSGGLVTAASWQVAPGFLSAGAGLAVALGAAVALNYSSSRSLSRSTSRQTTFIPDLSVSTLDRVLPVITQRIRNAGIAPVFLVDELDKVKDLSGRLRPVIGTLKKFVAESAVFCFLADRRYFEEIRAKVTEGVDSVLHTYYTHQLFIGFRPDDLHEYLEAITRIPDADDQEEGPDLQPIDPTSEGPSAEQEPPSRLKQDLRRRRLRRRYPEEFADREVLPYVLLHQSRMHPVDLHRRLAAYRGSDGRLAIPLGWIRSAAATRFDLLVQIAVEIVLDDPTVEAALTRQPHLRRLVYDALYYPSWKWRQIPGPIGGEGRAATVANEATLDLSRPEEFRRYLARRMGVDDGKRAPVSLISKESGVAPDSRQILDRNVEWLLEQVRTLAGLLADHQAFDEAMRDWQRRTGRRVGPFVRDALPRGSRFPPLLEDRGGGLFNWRYRYTGVPLTEDDESDTSGPDEAEVAEKAGFIHELAEYLVESSLSWSR